LKVRKAAAYAALALAVVPLLGAAAGSSALASSDRQDKPVYQNYYSPAPSPQWSEIEIATQQAEARKSKEARNSNLESYLANYGSPLAPYARDFIDAGDAYGVDYRVVVAIAGREQTFGVAWPGSSNNFWGYGGYRWPDVPTAIREYTRMISEEYPGLAKGDIYGSASRYAASGSWASGVSEFYGEMQNI